jgi:hypothetical protein
MLGKLRRTLSLGGKLVFVGALSLATAACQGGKQDVTSQELESSRAELATILEDPATRSKFIAKVMGSTVEAERHAFLKFHIFGYAGDRNLIPFFSMNNYVIQKWVPGEDSTFEVQHYEVAYYSKFDTDEAISEWQYPLTVR